MKVFWVLLLVQKCQELILHQIFRRLGSVPSVRLRRPWGESLWEASVSFLCLTGLVKFPSPLLVYRWLCCKEFFFFFLTCALQGLQLYHQWGRTANVPWKQEFRSFLQQNDTIMGLVRPWIIFWGPLLCIPSEGMTEKIQAALLLASLPRLLLCSVRCINVCKNSCTAKFDFVLICMIPRCSQCRFLWS